MNPGKWVILTHYVSEDIALSEYFCVRHQGLSVGLWCRTWSACMYTLARILMSAFSPVAHAPNRHMLFGVTCGAYMFATAF